MTNIGFVSLGCSKNLIDTEVMLKKLADAGYAIVPDETQADIVVVNTCGFIESAKQESIDNILDVAWLKTNGRLKGIVVTGCLAERYREQVIEEMPEVDAVLGTGSYDEIVTAIKAVEAGEKFTSFKDKEASPLGGERLVTTPEYTAYLKIAEGCDNRCTYCAIPSIRGRLRSRKIEEIVAEAKELEAIGVKELNLIAQDTSRYGLDLYGKYALADLVRALTKETSIPWIRLLYCYPDKITDDLIAEMRDNPRLLKYMDLPIQHISDKILTAMNRHGNAALIRDAVERVRKAIPGVTVRTTAIVGFPPEEGTPAASFPDQVDEQVKQDRYDILMQTQLEISAELQRAKIGSTVTVLSEGYDVVAGTHYGRSEADAPDVDGKVYFSSPVRVPAGTFVDVKITDALDYDLVGECVSTIDKKKR